MDLRAAIEAELEGVALRDLSRASEVLSARYREGSGPRARGWDDRERLAYLAVRMPATFAAASAVLRQVAAVLPDVRTLLDLGAGSGAVLWAAAGVWPRLESATMVDADAGMLSLGARVWRHHDRAADLQVESQSVRLAADAPLPPADVVTLSYVAGELDRLEASRLVRRAAEAARLAVIVLEPGTPRGYQRVLEARTALIERGSRVIAPCPHDERCPLSGEDWCHFAVRLDRSRAHRLLKQGALAWEDEKFSFVAASQASLARPGARVLRHPQIEKGRISLQLCTRDGLASQAVTRRDPHEWRAARHVRWGDAWPPEELDREAP